MIKLVQMDEMSFIIVLDRSRGGGINSKEADCAALVVFLSDDHIVIVAICLSVKVQTGCTVHVRMRILLSDGPFGRFGIAPFPNLSVDCCFLLGLIHFHFQGVPNRPGRCDTSSLSPFDGGAANFVRPACSSSLSGSDCIDHRTGRCLLTAGVARLAAHLPEWSSHSWKPARSQADGWDGRGLLIHR